jgi:hypothetical protein
MRKFSFLFLLLPALLHAQAMKVGGGALSSAVTPPAISVSVNPSLATVTVSTTQKFTVTLLNDTNNSGVFWTLEGPACLGLTCGSISNSTSINGGSTSYTAPSVVPSNPTVFLIAASVSDPTKFVTSTITVFQSSGGGGGGGSTPAPMVLNNRTTLVTPSGIYTGGPSTFNFTPLQGTLLDVMVFIPVSGASVSTITDTNGDLFVKGSCDGDIGITSLPNSGHIAVFNAFNAKIGTSSITVNWSSGGPAVNSIALIVRDISNNSNVNQATVVCGGSSVATSTPSGPGVVAGAGSLVLSGIELVGGTNVFSGVIPPPFSVATSIPGYTFAGSTDLAAQTGATYSPNWQLTSPSAWTGLSESFSSGSGGGGGGTPTGISVAISPTTASLGTGGTQTFTATVSNDSSNSGVTYSLSGAGCSGATCGTLTTGSVASLAHTMTTCGATAATSMTCTLGATSSGNLLVLQSGGAQTNVITKVVDNKTNTWVQGPSPTTNGCTNTSDNDRVQEWHAVGATPGVTALTLTVSPTGGSLFGFQELHMYDIAGADPASPFIKSDCQNNGTSNTTFAAPSETATIGGGFLVSGIQSSSGVSGVASPFTYDDDHVAHYFNPSPGTFTPTFSTGSAGTWTAFTSAFKPSSISTGTVLYTAPGSVPSPNTVTLTATSVKDPTKTATAIITIGGSPVIGVSVSPLNPTVQAGSGTISFVATVTNDAAGVNWTLLQNGGSCSGGCGSISATTSASGTPITYTPPSSVSSNQSFSLKACSITAPTTCTTATILVTPIAGPPTCGAPCPAFPGATGPGALATGGRGGVVYNITSLGDNTNPSCHALGDDTVTCTLRDCLQASGARNCVWRVAGAITNNSRLAITNANITIYGQSTPGGPITLHSADKGNCPSNNCGTFWVETGNVIARYITYDGNATGLTPGPDSGTVGYEIGNGNAQTVILDQMTARWWGNKVWVINSNDSGTTKNITVSNTLSYEPNIGHPVVLLLDTSCSISSGCNKAGSVNQVYHHNMAINWNHRWPMTNVGSVKWINNIGYNWGRERSPGDTSDFAGLLAAGTFDLIGNKLVDGPANNTVDHPYLFMASACGPKALDGCPDNLPGPPSIYMLNNIGRICQGNVINSCQKRTQTSPTHTVNSVDQVNQTYQGWEGGEEQRGAAIVDPVPNGWFRSTPQTADAIPVRVDPAENLDNILPQTVGNSRKVDCTGNFVNNRDSQDTRVISQYLAGGPGGPYLGGDYNGPTVSPAVASGTPCTETLHDGIPDAWRNRYHITRAYNATDPATGYTTLEEYMDGIVPTP